MLKLVRKNKGPRQVTANGNIAFRFEASSKVSVSLELLTGTSDIATVMFRKVSVEEDAMKLVNKVSRFTSITSPSTSPVESFMI